jgi:hypothetical protein
MKQILQDIIFCYLAQNKTKEWVKNLDLIQAMKNSRWHSTIKISPFECTYGYKINVPAEIVDFQVLKILYFEIKFKYCFSVAMTDTMNMNCESKRI